MSAYMRPSRALGFASPASPWWTYARYPDLWKGCVGYWAPLLGPSGATLFDVSGYANHGAIANADMSSSWVGGQQGGEFQFDATDAYAALSSILLTVGQPFSISWWETITSDTNAYPSRMCLQVNGSSKHFILLRTKTNAFYRYMTWGESPSAESAMDALGVTPPSACIGVPKHFCLTGTNPLSTTAADFSLYEDGISKTVSKPGQAFGTVAVNRIGWDGADNGADAGISDFAIFNRRLERGEVAVLAQRPGIMLEIDYEAEFAAQLAAAANRRRRLLTSCR